MAIVLQGSSLYESASSTTAVLTYPVGIVLGELLLAHIGCSNVTAPTTAPSGWTLAKAQNGETAISGSTFYRIANGSETGTVTFTANATAGRVTGFMGRWSGVDATTPFDAAAVGANSPISLTFSMPNISTASADAVLVHTIVLNAADRTANDLVTLSGTTRIGISTGTGRITGIYSEARPAAGATGARTWTKTGATTLQWAGITTALKPAVVAPPVVLPTSFINTAEGGVDGAMVTSANSGGASGDAVDVVSQGSGNTFTFSSEAAVPDRSSSLGYRLGYGTSAAGTLGWDVSVPGRLALRFYLYIPTIDGGSLTPPPQPGAVVLSAQGALTGVGQTTSPFTGVPIAGEWTQTFADEFNGTSLDTTKWQGNWYAEGGVMNNVGTYARNVTVSGGNLNLRLESASAGALVHTDIATGYKLPVGSYVEARILFPGGSTCSNWPAWWANPTAADGWPSSGEHDIAEVLSGQLTVNYHSPSGAHNQGAVPGTWGGAFHTYGLHRKAGSADVYWDGTLVKSYTTDDTGKPEILILNHGSGGTAAIGAMMQVDYVRAYEPSAYVPPPTGGVTVPTGNLPGWNFVMSEDFTTNAALGQFSTVYPGDWNAANGQFDTSRVYGRPAATQGQYDTNMTCTVHDSMLDMHVYTDANGRPWVATPIPPIGTWGQLYGRYAVRFRSDTVQGFKMAWLLWPTSENWANGEIDYPEAGLGGTIGGFSHDVNGTPANNAWSVNTGVNMADWHIAVIEWSPGSVVFKLDDTVYTTTNSAAIPTTPMYWKLQTETELSSTPPPTSAQGHVYIDWVAVWSRA